MQVINMRMLRDSRAVGKKIDFGVKLLGNGVEEVDIPINIEVLWYTLDTLTQAKHIPTHA